MTIHARLKGERERLELSQTRLADLAGVGKTTVINWEKGASSPDASQLAAVAESGVDVLFVVTGQRSQSAPEVDLLPSDERVLIDSYRRCNPDAKRNLIQTAALLSAGMAATGSPPGGHHAGGSIQQNTGNNNIQIGNMDSAPRTRKR